MRTSASLTLLVALLASACAAGPRAGASGGAGGVPDFTLPDTRGGAVRLSDHRGKVVVVTFWATWCAPCAAEHPQLERLWREYQDEGLVVLAVSMDGPESIAEVPSMVAARGLTFPVLLDEETRVTGALNPRRSAPYTLVLGRDGDVAWTHDGYSAGDELELEAQIRKLL